MATATELLLEEELAALREVALARGWAFEVVNSVTYILELPAKDGSIVQFYVECDEYPGLPPKWHVRNPDRGTLDEAADFPRGGSYFHASGVICAPWNRLSYAQVRPGAPHSEWDIGNWRANEKLGGGKTLCAMALRLAVELSTRYEGRRS